MENNEYPRVELTEEDITILSDEHGNVMECVFAEGHCLSAAGIRRGKYPDPRVNFKRLREMNVRPDDVFICAYPKAGTHWLSEIVTMLRKNKAEYDVKKKECYMIDFHTPENLDKLPSPRTLNSHLRFSLLPRQIKEKKCKIIYIERNPKDIAVSYFYHCQKVVQYKGNFAQFAHIFMSDRMYHEPWAEYTLNWGSVRRENPDLQVHCLFYEDLKENPVTEIKKLASFLSCEVDDELATKIVNLCAFDELKNANKSIKDGRSDDFMFRKGEVGDWKNYFTVALNEKFDEFLKNKMKDSTTRYKYEI